MNKGKLKEMQTTKNDQYQDSDLKLRKSSDTFNRSQVNMGKRKAQWLKPALFRACALQQEKPLQWEAAHPTREKPPLAAPGESRGSSEDPAQSKIKL